MLRIEIQQREHNGFRITVEALMLYVNGCRFCLAINEYVEDAA